MTQHRCPGHGPQRETYYCDGRCQHPIHRPSNILQVATGPCEAQATFTCTGAGMLRLNPMAMLPASEVPNAYVPICQPCYDHLADQYVSQMRVQAEHVRNAS